MFPFVVSRIGLLEFQDYLESSRLLDIVRRGCFFTWSNRQLLNPIARKLNRALSNKSWVVTFPQSTAVFDAPGGSDHSPCLVSLTEGVYRRKSPFKFFTFFSIHPDYHSLLREYWEDVLPVGIPMVTLCKRLKAAKVCCKTLNRNSFSNVQLRSKEAFEKLTEVQRQLHCQPSQSLFEDERQAQESWIFWTETEESFSGQNQEFDG